MGANRGGGGVWGGVGPGLIDWPGVGPGWSGGVGLSVWLAPGGFAGRVGLARFAGWAVVLFPHNRHFL